MLDGADLVLHDGEVVAIVGENGVGKTSLLRICAGLMAPDAGAVDRRGRVGYCPQEPALFDLLSAREHVVLFGRASGLDRATALRRGDDILGEFGFDASDDTFAKALSGGTRQKLNLSLALLANPDVLLLDEPYQGFDHGTYVDFWDHVDRWRVSTSVGWLTSAVVPRELEGTLLLIGLVGLQTSIPLSGTAQLLVPLLRAAAAHGNSPGVSPSRPRAVARRPVPGTIAAELRRGERDDR